MSRIFLKIINSSQDFVNFNIREPEDWTDLRETLLLHLKSTNPRKLDVAPISQHAQQFSSNFIYKILHVIVCSDYKY